MGLPSRIPRLVGGGSGSGAASVYTDTGVNYDVAIGGLPFMLKPDQNNPSVRRTADYRTQQIDQSTEPGEQSTVQWWIESQSTFHLGSGQKYMDTPAPGNEGVRKLRYATSTGINPWNIGQLELLSQTQRAFTITPSNLLTADTVGATTQFVVTNGSGLTKITESVVSGVPSYSSTSLSYAGGGLTILGLASDGTNLYFCNSSFLFRLSLVTGGTAPQVYTMPSGTTSCVLSWVKQRLVAAVTIGGGSPAAKIYTLDSFPASPPAAFPTANYTHPNPAWQWTAITEGPGAIYVSGFAGNHSTIDKFVLDGTGAMPTLAGASTAVDFPPGEIVLGMTGYVSTVLGVATTRGFRVGTFAGGGVGDVQMGPLSLQTTTLTGAVTGADRFFYAGGTHDDGTAGLWRVDTSQPIRIKQFSYVPDQVFGTATDLRAADSSELPVAGAVSAVRPTSDGRMGFLVPGFGLYVQHPTKLVPSGTLTTSRMRYQTLDPKLVRFVRFRGETLAASGVLDAGTISVSVSNTDLPFETIGTLSVGSRADTGDMATTLPATTQVTLNFILTRAAGDTSIGPCLTNYQLKALPAQRRQRNIILPLSIFDHEQDNVGSEVGGDGTALVRLRQLELMEDASDIVTLQYLGSFSDQLLAEFVVIDKIEFAETVDPTPKQGWGGIGVVTLRTVA